MEEAANNKEDNKMLLVFSGVWGTEVFQWCLAMCRCDMAVGVAEERIRAVPWYCRQCICLPGTVQPYSRHEIPLQSLQGEHMFHISLIICLERPENGLLILILFIWIFKNPTNCWEKKLASFLGFRSADLLNCYLFLLYLANMQNMVYHWKVVGIADFIHRSHFS